MRPMETLQDLIEEAKVRTVWWGLCIFGISYFLSHTSKSMWTNIPLSIIILCALRYLFYEVELRWKAQPVDRQSYQSNFQKRQITPEVSATPPIPSWKKKINSPHVEAAICSFINKVLQDFMVDLWYSSLTPDKEAPALIRMLLLDVAGGLSARIKEMNLVNLLTRDMVLLVGKHLDLFRKNKSFIGAEVIGTLSNDQLDEMLKYHLLAGKKLHPALISPDREYKVLQRLVDGVLTNILEPREAECPLVKCFSRELLTCLVLQPVMNLASPVYINELIEVIFLASEDGNGNRQVDKTTHDISASDSYADDSHSDLRRNSTSSHGDMRLETSSGETSSATIQNVQLEHRSNASLDAKPADWARPYDAATQRRTQVLEPENLDNMWTKGRNYKRKAAKLGKSSVSPKSMPKPSGLVDNDSHAGSRKKTPTNIHSTVTDLDNKNSLTFNHMSNTQLSRVPNMETSIPQHVEKILPIEGYYSMQRQEGQGNQLTTINKNQLKRSSSTSEIKKKKDFDATFSGQTGDADSKEVYQKISKQNVDVSVWGTPEPISISEGCIYAPKLKCRVEGAHFEKIGSDSFAVYSICVTDSDNKSWLVKRRFRNFEQLHRYLKDIPNYSLHLPPKRFLSSSIDYNFVHQRCILLNKYLQDLLSIANVAEQHEVWDFLSAISKNYSYGKSTSVMKTLVVNVDDAMDDIARQFRGVSDGLRQKVVGSPSLSQAISPSMVEKMSLSYTEESSSKPSPGYSLQTHHSLSDVDTHGQEDSVASISGWHSDNELNSKSLPPRSVDPSSETGSLDSQRHEPSEKFKTSTNDQDVVSNNGGIIGLSEDQINVPPGWSPPNVSVPILNLVDNIFQLKQRGWIRRQVFWISKQILQLMMEDAIDDWLLRQIHWLRKDEVIAQGIRWVQDVLWPNGIFFTKVESDQTKAASTRRVGKLAPNRSWRVTNNVSDSFKQQLEVARRASEVKKLILGGAPATLVSLIGAKQYRRCAKDVHHFLQSTICIKQLAYDVLELVLISIFPELDALIKDIHQKSQTQTEK